MDIEKEYTHLAVAVLEQGIKDLTCKSKSQAAKRERHKAYYYFRRTNKDFEFWCEVLEKDPEITLEKIKKEYADDFKRVFDEIQRDRQANKAAAG